MPRVRAFLHEPTGKMLTDQRGEGQGRRLAGAPRPLPQSGAASHLPPTPAPQIRNVTPGVMGLGETLGLMSLRSKRLKKKK